MLGYTILKFKRTLWIIIKMDKCIEKINLKYGRDNCIGLLNKENNYYEITIRFLNEEHDKIWSCEIWKNQWCDPRFVIDSNVFKHVSRNTKNFNHNTFEIMKVMDRDGVNLNVSEINFWFSFHFQMNMKRGETHQ